MQHNTDDGFGQTSVTRFHPICQYISLLILITFGILIGNEAILGMTMLWSLLVTMCQGINYEYITPDVYDATIEKQYSKITTVASLLCLTPSPPTCNVEMATLEKEEVPALLEMSRRKIEVKSMKRLLIKYITENVGDYLHGKQTLENLPLPLREMVLRQLMQLTMRCEDNLGDNQESIERLIQAYSQLISPKTKKIELGGFISSCCEETTVLNITKILELRNQCIKHLPKLEIVNDYADNTRGFPHQPELTIPEETSSLRHLVAAPTTFDLPVAFPNVTHLKAHCSKAELQDQYDSILRFANIESLMLPYASSLHFFLEAYGANLQTLIMNSRCWYKYSFKQIFDACPKLQRLEMYNVQISDDKKPIESFSQLRELRMTLGHYLDHNIVLTNILSAPNLEKISLSCYLEELDIDDLRKLMSLIADEKILRKLTSFCLRLSRTIDYRKINYDFLRTLRDFVAIAAVHLPNLVDFTLWLSCRNREDGFALSLRSDQEKQLCIIGERFQKWIGDDSIANITPATTPSNCIASVGLPHRKLATTEMEVSVLLALVRRRTEVTSLKRLMIQFVAENICDYIQGEVKLEHLPLTLRAMVLQQLMQLRSKDNAGDKQENVERMIEAYSQLVSAKTKKIELGGLISFSPEEYIARNTTDVLEAISSKAVGLEHLDLHENSRTRIVCLENNSINAILRMENLKIIQFSRVEFTQVKRICQNLNQLQYVKCTKLVHASVSVQSTKPSVYEKFDDALRPTLAKITKKVIPEETSALRHLYTVPTKTDLPAAFPNITHLKANCFRVDGTLHNSILKFKRVESLTLFVQPFTTTLDSYLKAYGANLHTIIIKTIDFVIISFKRIFDACPNLEKLELCNLQVSDSKEPIESFAQLRSFHWTPKHDKSDTFMVTNILAAPNLEKFSLKDLNNDLGVDDLRKLTSTVEDGMILRKLTSISLEYKGTIVESDISYEWLRALRDFVAVAAAYLPNLVDFKLELKWRGGCCERLSDQSIPRLDVSITSDKQRHTPTYSISPEGLTTPTFNHVGMATFQVNIPDLLELVRRRTSGNEIKSLKKIATITVVESIGYHVNGEVTLKNLAFTLRVMLMHELNQLRINDYPEVTQENVERRIQAYSQLVCPQTRKVELAGLMCYFLGESSTQRTTKLLEAISSKAAGLEHLGLHANSNGICLNFEKNFIKPISSMGNLKIIHFSNVKYIHLKPVCKNLKKLQYVNCMELEHFEEEDANIEDFKSSFSHLRVFLFIQSIPFSFGKKLRKQCIQHLPKLEVVADFADTSSFHGSGFNELVMPAQTSALRHLHAVPTVFNLPAAFPNVTHLNVKCTEVKPKDRYDSTLRFASIESLTLYTCSVDSALSQYLEAYGANLHTLNLYPIGQHCLKCSFKGIFDACPKLRKLTLYNVQISDDKKPIKSSAQLRELHLKLGHNNVKLELTNILAVPNLEKVCLDSKNGLRVDELRRLTTLMANKKIWHDLTSLSLECELTVVDRKRYFEWLRALRDFVAVAAAYLPKISLF
ncbi:Hypothetical predicted protein [Cloeon dipterum]|uniref:Uncharacterized protein n=1 Tax=Cloeon dipterum TaxID=197152 RepID=A0A8S1D5M1_9INSE|nr:Hypothetical predicted protein [Cloeon dipterum]